MQIVYLLFTLTASAADWLTKTFRSRTSCSHFSTINFNWQKCFKSSAFRPAITCPHFLLNVWEYHSCFMHPGVSENLHCDLLVWSEQKYHVCNWFQCFKLYSNYSFLYERQKYPWSLSQKGFWILKSLTCSCRQDHLSALRCCFSRMDLSITRETWPARGQRSNWFYVNVQTSNLAKDAIRLFSYILKTKCSRLRVFEVNASMQFLHVRQCSGLHDKIT